MFKRIVGWALLGIVSSRLNAQPLSEVELDEVLTPNTVLLKTSESRVVTLTLMGPFFGDAGNQSCHRNQSVMALCNQLTQLLRKQDLKLIISKAHNGVIFGDLMVGDSLISEKLIAEGIYKFDHQYSRALYLVNAQNKARCAYKGIWTALRGDPKVAAQCQQL